MTIYAKLLSETSIDRNPPRSAVIDGAQVVGDLPEPYLNSQNWFRLTETPMPENPQDGYHAEPRYAYDSDETPTRIIESWEVVQDEPPPPRTFSKLKLVEQAEKHGIADQVIVMLRDNALLYEKWSAASVLREDNESFKAGKALAKSMLGLSDELIESALAASVAD